MSKKKDEKLTNLAADFFGEEGSWFDEDSQELSEPGSNAKPTDSTEPTVSGAPPPRSEPPAPPPFDPSRAGQSVVPRSQPSARWAQQRGQTPQGQASMSTQKTLMFSDIPTLPPLSEEADVDEDETPTVDVDREARLAAIDALERHANSPDLPPSIPPTAFPEPDKPASDYDLMEPSLTEDSVPTEGPAPSGPDEDTLHDEQSPTAIDSRPLPGGAHHLTVTPLENVAPEGWEALSGALETEAAVAAASDRGQYLLRAGWVRRHQLDQASRALELYERAADAGCNHPLLYRELADLAATEKRWSDSALAYEGLAEVSTGFAAAEAYRDAAVVHIDRGSPNDAARCLGAALDAAPDDLDAMLMISNLREASTDLRARALEMRAGLADGWARASLLVAAAGARADHDPKVEPLLRMAVDAEPGHTGASLNLQARLRAAGDYHALAELIEQQVHDAPAAERGIELCRVARYHMRAGEHDAARKAFADARAAGCPWVGHAFLAEALREGTSALIAEALRGEADASDPTQAAWLWFLLGWHLERSGEPGDAVEAYRRCLQADRDAVPAEEGALRCMAQLEDRGPLIARLEEAVASGRSELLLSLAEAAEDAGDWDRALTAYGSLHDDDAGTLAIKRAGMARILTRRQDWAALSELLEQRADSVTSPSLKAHLLHAAGAVGPRVEPADPERAIALYEQALALSPDHLGVLDAIAPLLSAAGRHGELAEHHRRASDATSDEELELLLRYRASRLFEKAGDITRARQCVDRLLKTRPDFQPAKILQRNLGARGDDRELLRSHHLAKGDVAAGEATATWHRFAAAVVTGLDTDVGRSELRALLQSSPGHPAISDLLAVALDAAGAVEALGAMLVERMNRSDAHRYPALTALRIARIHSEAGARNRVPEILGRAEFDESLVNIAARIARSAGHPGLAVELLGRSRTQDSRLERAELNGNLGSNLAAVERELRSLHADGVASAPAMAFEIGMRHGHSGMLAFGRDVLCTDDRPAVRFVHLVGLADRESQAGAFLQACERYAEAAAIRPDSTNTATAAVRVAAKGGLDRIEELAKLPANDPIIMSVVLEGQGRSDGARAVLQAAELDSLPSVLHLQRLLEAAHAWPEAYQCLVRRLELSRDEEQRRQIEARRRGLLADQLSHTDQAWELFQQLHEREPDDARITETLARIAASRGDTSKAVEFLEDLAKRSGDVQTSARYKRRIAEALRQAGDVAAARTAYYEALDLKADDSEALDGLLALAEEGGDWEGLVSVYRRQADLVDESERASVLRRIAKITEGQLADPARALEAWQAVLELNSADEEALQQAVGLTARLQDWPQFVELGNVLAALSRGADRTMLLRRIGVVCIEHLNRDDGIRYLERAITEEPADLQAAKLLEEIYRRRSDAQGVARTLEIQGRMGATPEDKVRALSRAAHHELSSRHDRDAASGFYTKVLQIQPDNEEALRFMAAHLFESGRFDEALPVCERLAPIVENDQDLDDFDVRMELAQFYYYYAEMLRLSEGEERAVPQYERALELNPTYVAALEAVGPLYKETEDWEKALRVFRQLLQLSGGQGERHKVASNYTNLGMVERALGNSDKAKKRFNKALEIDPNHVDALKGMALLLEDREDWSNLLNIYNNIIYHATVAEDVIDAYMTKGRVLDDHMSRPDKAAQHYQRSLDFKPDQPIALLRLAELAMRRDAYQEAGDLAARGAKLVIDEPPLVEGLLLLCEAAARQDASRKDDALALVAKAKATGAFERLPAGLLDDLEAMRQYIRDHLPR